MDTTELKSMRMTLFLYLREHQWDKIEETYGRDDRIRSIKITKSGDTVLHLALLSREVEVANRLLKMLINNAGPVDHRKDHDSKESSSNSPNHRRNEVLRIRNNRGNIPLHLAAEIGAVSLCEKMAEQDPELVNFQNNDGETPLFVAVLHGRKDTFHKLDAVFRICMPPYGKHDRQNNEIDNIKEPPPFFSKTIDGNTFLHAAISAEHFSLAKEIIDQYPALVERRNVRGLTPLHVLARKPYVFRSGTHLSFIENLIYECATVDIKEPLEVEDIDADKDAGGKDDSQFPENYKMCMEWLKILLKLGRILLGFGRILLGKGRTLINFICKKNKSDQSSSPEGANMCLQFTGADLEDGDSEKERKEWRDRFFPRNCATCVNIFQFAMKLFLVILGIGNWKVNKLKKEKQRHQRSSEVMNLLVGMDKTYFTPYDDGGNPSDSYQEFDFSRTSPTEEFGWLSEAGDNEDKKFKESAEQNTVKVAEELLRRNQLMIQGIEDDPDEQKEYRIKLEKVDETPGDVKKRMETALLTAAKMGVTEIVKKILDTFPMAIHDMDSEGKNAVLLAVENRQIDVLKVLLDDRYMIKDSVSLDKEGNTALHLAANCTNRRPWLIPGAALQMQWEYKWYQYVEKSMPSRYSAGPNKKGLMADGIFQKTHEDLVKEGSEWLIKTSESCSVVAALVAGVAFATAATVPGGQEKGRPVYEDRPAFHVFAIASLIALCLSVTALIFFLSILTSRHQEKDFAKSLPFRLLLGLTALSGSITAVLTSFCAGHIFIMNHKFRYVAYLIYATAGFPVSFFVFVQLPLYIDLLIALFRKVPQRSHKLISDH